jgi:rhamnosyltransferase
MWQRGMAEYDLSQFEELLLTNSSIIGPLQPLAPFWQSSAVADCDFWGFSDNDEFKLHLCPYFVVFRKRLLHSARFGDFWRSVLPYPYQSKQQVIFSYELGLSDWLQTGGFKWRVIFPQKQVIEDYRSGRNLWQKCLDLYHRRALRYRCTILMYADVLCRRGMPFLKVSLLHQRNHRMMPSLAFSLLEQSTLPPEILADLRRIYGIPGK